MEQVDCLGFRQHGYQAIINMEVPFHKLDRIGIMLLCTFFYGSSQPVYGHTRSWPISNDVDLQPICSDFLVDVTVLVPLKKMERVAVVFTHQQTMDHLLNVHHDCNLLLPKA